MLPCPSLALCETGDHGLRAALSPFFDLILEDSDQADHVSQAVLSNPLAASTLVHLLRLSAGLPAHDALMAESLAYSTLQGGPEFRAWLAQHRTALADRQRSRSRTNIDKSSSREPIPKTEHSLDVGVKTTAGERSIDDDHNQAAVGSGQHRHSQGAAVLARRDGPLFEITLNRPDTHNAFNAEMRDGLVQALETAEADDRVAGIVVRGTGSSFCSGGDLAEFGTTPDAASAHLVRATRNAARAMAVSSARLRVEVHGACVGAGVELPAFAAHVTARQDAYFQLPEVGMGLVPGAGGTVSVPRRIGRQRTAYMAITGRRIDAATALGWGLIDELVG